MSQRASHLDRSTGRGRWVDNIKLDLRCDGVIWTGFDVAQDRGQWRALVNMIMNLRVP
jgi:hypothetical protein